MITRTVSGEIKELRDYLVKRNRPVGAHPHSKKAGSGSATNLKRRREVSTDAPNVKESKQKDANDVSTTEESFTNAEYSVMSELDTESFEDFSDDEGMSRPSPTNDSALLLLIVVGLNECH